MQWRNWTTRRTAWKNISWSWGTQRWDIFWFVFSSRTFGHQYNSSDSGVHVRNVHDSPESITLNAALRNKVVIDLGVVELCSKDRPEWKKSLKVGRHSSICFLVLRTQTCPRSTEFSEQGAKDFEPTSKRMRLCSAAGLRKHWRWEAGAQTGGGQQQTEAGTSGREAATRLCLAKWLFCQARGDQTCTGESLFFFQDRWDGGCQSCRASTENRDREKLFFGEIFQTFVFLWKSWQSQLGVRALWKKNSACILTVDSRWKWEQNLCLLSSGKKDLHFRWNFALEISSVLGCWLTVCCLDSLSWRTLLYESGATADFATGYSHRWGDESEFSTWRTLKARQTGKTYRYAGWDSLGQARYLANWPWKISRPIESYLRVCFVGTGVLIRTRTTIVILAVKRAVKLTWWSNIEVKLVISLKPVALVITRVGSPGTFHRFIVSKQTFPNAGDTPRRNFWRKHQDEHCSKQKNCSGLALNKSWSFDPQHRDLESQG